MTITEGIAKVVERVDLQEEEMIKIMEKIMEGSVSESQIGAFLIGLRMKGESISEITGAAKVMRSKSRKIKSAHPVVVDLCGTGGGYAGHFQYINSCFFYNSRSRCGCCQTRKQICFE